VSQLPVQSPESLRKLKAWAGGQHPASRQAAVAANLKARLV